MKKIYLMLLISVILVTTLVSAASLETLGTFKQTEIVRINQVCSDSTYITITKIIYPNSSDAYVNKPMIASGSGGFYFDYNLTLPLGRYNVLGISDGCTKTFATFFDITPSGQGGTDNLVFIIFIIVLIYAINLFGFFGKNEIMTMLGGMFLMALGIYLINNGLIIYRDWLTNYLAYITIGWGFISTMIAGEEMMNA